MAAHMRAMQMSTGYDSGRPTKKDRRELERFRDNLFDETD
jgi:hypothetical protein